MAIFYKARKINKKGAFSSFRLGPTMIPRVQKIIDKKDKHIIGLISGMSMDGVDLAHVKISGIPPKLDVAIIGSFTQPYPDDLKTKLISVAEGNAYLIPELNLEVAENFADAVNHYLNKQNIHPDQIDAIGSHGQTIYYLNSPSNKTLNMQIGDPSYIAFQTGIPVVANFRQKDIAAGGTGAPLVPLIDYYLFREEGSEIALVNLGSISNATVASEKIEDVIAFDCGPANMASDFFYRTFFPNGEGFDHGGSLGMKGKIIPGLLHELLDLPYFKRGFPKAAGYEDLGPPILKNYLKKYENHLPEDFIHTGNVWAAKALRAAFESAILPKFPHLSKIKLSGGGVHNEHLVFEIEKELSPIEVSKMSSRLNDSKEALSFAVLAHEYFHERPGNVIGATGAQKRVVLGELVLPD